MSLNALGKGSKFPPLKEDTLRLYGMRFCPYVKRSRLVLADKKIPHEIVNINLVEKPEWFLQRFPDGKVPVLQRNDQIVTESLIIADYLDEISPEDKLHPADPYKKAVGRCLVAKFNKISDNCGKAVHNPSEIKAAFQEITLGLETFETELSSNNTLFFGGNRPRMVDLMIWPWFEIFMCAENYFGPEYSFDDLLPELKFGCLRDWIKNMMAFPSVKQLMNIEAQKLFADSVRAGKRDFDIGL